MSIIYNGGPAFPATHEVNTGVETHIHTGMTLRDYFAAQVLNAVMVNATGDFTPEGLQKACSLCYIFADGMLAAREKKV